MPPLTLTVNNDTTVNCPGDPIVLNAIYGGGAQPSLMITWSDGVNTYTGNNIPVNPKVTTTYTASINDTCISTSFTVTVSVHPPLLLTTSNDTTVCVGDTLSLYATASGGEGTYSYSWNGSFSSNAIGITANYDANYNVVVTDCCGTQASNSVTVTVTSPVADFTYEYTSQFGVQFTDSSYHNIVAYDWTFAQSGSSNQENHFHDFGEDGEHDVWLTVTDENGCVATVMQTVIPPIFVYAPNAFTPDGDGVNDIFAFKGMGIEFFELLIYNRWGELMFTATSIAQGWDGTYKGKLVQNGTYVYKVRAESYSKEVYENAGKLSLLR